MSTPARRRLIRDFKKLQQVGFVGGVFMVLARFILCMLAGSAHVCYFFMVWKCGVASGRGSLWCVARVDRRGSLLARAGLSLRYKTVCVRCGSFLACACRVVFCCSRG